MCTYIDETKKFDQEKSYLFKFQILLNQYVILQSVLDQAIARLVPDL